MNNHIPESWGEKRYIPIASKLYLLWAIYFYLPFLNSQKERSIPKKGTFMPVSSQLAGHFNYE